MKILITILILVLVGLQYKLWFGDGSLSEVVQLTRELELQKQKLQELESRNRILEAQVLAEIFNGSSVAFWILADRMLIGLSTLRKFLQQQYCPHRS